MPNQTQDIVVVSDLHLGRGKNPRTGRFYRLEAFFYDDDFEAFCDYLVDEARERGRPFKLIINGDGFDLLRIDHEPEEGESQRERRYGPVMTPDRAARTIRDILAGHPRFVAGLATVVDAGHEVVFLPGNHDPELQWEPVQAEVRQALLEAVREQGGDRAVASAEERIHFEPWFYYEPGRVWIEHGCQYDPENAFTYPLRRRLADESKQVHESEKDTPLGTFFQRYLYNAFGNITFIVPNSRSNVRYFRWLVLNRPRLLAKVVRSHLPFFLQVLRRIAKAGTSDQALRRCHETELDRLSHESGLGEKLEIIDALKQVHASAALVVRQVMIRILKIGVFALLGSACAFAIWFLGLRTIATGEYGFGIQTVLFLVMQFLFLVAAGGGLIYLLLRPSGEPPDINSRHAAGKIADLLDVPIVAFGHTHDEAIIALDRNGRDGAWYFNTGTWIAVFTPDQLLPRERVQYTFLRIRGKRGELLHWSPGRGEPAPVVLLEDEHKPAGVRAG